MGLIFPFGDANITYLKTLRGCKGDPSAPCPHQSKLIEKVVPLSQPGVGEPNAGDAIIPTNPTTGQDPTLVCVP